MPGLAVVTAFNPDNYGMYSVDLAAGVVFDGLCRPWTPVVTQGNGRIGRLRLEPIRDVRAFARFDTVVYWGDFLNNPMWGERDYAPRETRRHGVGSRGQGLKNWRALYLELKHHHPALRVLSLGGCFLGADGAAMAPIRPALREFLEGADLIAPRDERSSEIVRALAPRARLAPGIDCAWLLEPPEAPPERRGGHFVWSLGRTLRHSPRGWIRELSRRTGLRAVRLDWLNRRHPRFLAHWNYERMARLVTGAEFVVTDTYHLVINTLLRGVRAVCLFDPAEAEGNGTLGDAKKPLLLRQLGMPELLVDVTGERALAGAVQARMAAFGHPELARALEAFRPRREAFRRMVEDAIRSPAAAPAAAAAAR